MIGLVTSGLILVGLQTLVFWVLNRRIIATFGSKTVYSL
jgi:hypothetical protein